MSAWAHTRLGTRHLNFVDHSGLGGASVVSTSDMVRLLAAPGVEPLLGPILKPIAVLDPDRNLIKNSGISIAAKTGTLDFVSTLSGYVTAPDGRPMAFAIFTGDLPKRSAAKAAGEAVPQGARTFNTRAKKLQQVLLQRWAAFYGS
jgi:D-alanyl-D-alanine carboxypeptidase/D-alanyl-D-alanine-endopeptidase (penicillin-binding protein 4)